MKNNTGTWLAVLALAAGFCAAPAVAQDILDGKAAGEKADGTGNEDLGRLLKLSPEELDALMLRAKQAQLRVERDQAAAEIRDEFLYDENLKVKKEAISLLKEKSASTPAGNIELICKAFALVDDQFRLVKSLFDKGKYADAVVAAKKALDPRQATYRSAAMHYLYAEALLKANKPYEAVEAYRRIMTDMPDRISFAASSGVRAAETFEKLGRFYYAMQMYVYCVRNYGLTLDDKTLDRMTARAEELSKLYKDPLNSVAQRMGEVAKRLEKIEGGPETQKKQKQIVALLEDMIKTAEEQKKQGRGNGQKQNRKRGQGQDQGQRQEQAQGRQPKGAGPPSSPAQVSAVVPGPVQRPNKLGRIQKARGETGVWATMPPREKMRLEAIKKKLMSERYRDQISDYRSSLTKEP